MSSGSALESLAATWLALVGGMDTELERPEVLEPDAEVASPARQAAKAAWAKLIRKVYEVDPLLCPKCGAQMRVIALIEDPAVASRT